jgi:complement component 1 Q subcomponent-binding protein
MHHHQERLLSSAANNLGSILQREINEEEEAAADYSGGLPPDLAELQRDVAENWTILEGIQGIGSDGETGSGATVRMFKKTPGSNGAKIGIVFHCQDTEEDIPFDEDAFLEDQAQDDDEEEEPAQAVRFGVTVSKGGKTVVLQCRSGGDGEISVEGVTVRDGESEDALLALAGGESLNAALYQGPEFTELAEDLQESFQQYVVQECGVDEDVAAFIAMYADYREQAEYVTWMKTAIDILD